MLPRRRARKPRGRGPVHRLDRLEKAQMIAAVLSEHLGGPVVGRKVLDIGCGNGDISMLFARKNQQAGVDLTDRRRPGNTGFEFALVDSEVLPFADASFDVVLSHHVIEHVADQGLHLDEIRRVLAPGCVCYLATPNRSSPIMEGHVGNAKVLRHRQMAPLFERHGFRPREYTVEVLKHPRRFHGEIPYARWLPRPLLRALRPLYPSHIFVLDVRR